MTIYLLPVVKMTLIDTSIAPRAVPLKDEINSPVFFVDHVPRSSLSSLSMHQYRTHQTYRSRTVVSVALTLILDALVASCGGGSGGEGAGATDTQTGTGQTLSGASKPASNSPLSSMTVPCGSTDTQISAAETTLASTGGVIYLQACSYTINDPITLHSSVSILGVPTTQTTSNGLIGGGDTISHGTILIAGTATQALIANTTGSPTWPNGTISGVEIGNISFSGFSGGAIVIGANGNGGAAFSNFHDLDFYNCGKQSATWADNRYSMSIENFATINVAHVRAHSPLNGFQFLVGNSVSDELGNSQFTDMLVDFETESSTVQTFVHSYVFGSDQAATSSTLNEIKAYQLAAYGFNRPSSGLSDTATFSGGTTFTVGTGSNFPVGMPVIFTAGSGNVRSNIAYFIQSQSGNALSIGSCRTTSECPAVSLPSSGTSTIKQFGFPLLDLGGVTPNAALSDSQFTGLDLEGYVACAIYLENVVDVSIGISQTNGSSAAGGFDAPLCSRKSVGFAVDSPQPIAEDNDGYGYSQTDGGAFQGTNIGAIGNGLFDWFPTDGSGSNSIPSLNIGGSYNSNTGPDIQYRGTAFLYPNTPIGERINTANGAGAATQLAYYQSGFYSLDQTVATTYYIPYLVGNTNSYITYNLGEVWEFFNQGTGTATIRVCNSSGTNPSCTGGQNVSGNLFNNVAHANNQIVLTQGQSARIISAHTSSGVNYWAVIYTNGTIN